MSSIGESIMGSIFRVWIYLIMIIFIVCGFMYIYHINQSNQYISVCNSVVERQGGMTKTAYDKCNDISRRGFSSMFHVSTDPDVQAGQNTPNGLTNDVHDNYEAQQVYGKPVTYYIYATTRQAGLPARDFNNAGHPMVSTVESDVRRGSING